MNKIIEEDVIKILQSNIEWSSFKNKTVLITGANGFLPAYMVETLMYLNIHSNFDINVVCLVRNLVKAQNRFTHYLNNTHLLFLHQDVCDPINYDGEVDFIIHAASQASPKYYSTDPVGTMKANVIGTNNLLEFAKKKEVVSFLYFSSGEVYGEVSQDQLPIKETSFGYLDCNKIRSCYAESKRMGENMCQCYYVQYGVNTKVVRPTHTYGPKMDLNDSRVFADFVNNIVNNKNIELHSEGNAYRTFCYLSDATEAFFRILLNKNGGQAYNMGNPSCEISIKNLASLLVDLYPMKKLKVVINYPISTNCLASNVLRSGVNIEKLISIGWFPSVSIQDGFRRTIDSYNE